MIRSLDVLIALFLLSVSLNVHSQSIGSSLIVHAGFQTGIAEFKPDDEYTVSTEDNQLYVAPYLAIGLKSGSGPWAFTFTVSSPIREFSYFEDLYRPGGPILFIPFREYSFRYITLDGNVIYALNDKFRVVVGPNMQALYDVKLYSEETDYTTSFIGLNAGVELHIDRFILGSYYASPLRSVGIYGSSMTYQSVQLRLGYSIF